MLGVILVPDYEWFEFLSRQPQLDEVNSWRPSDARTPHQLVPGTSVISGHSCVPGGMFAKREKYIEAHAARR